MTDTMESTCMTDTIESTCIIEKIKLSYGELAGNFRRYDSGNITITSKSDSTETIIQEVKVDLFYDGYDDWGYFRHTFKIGDTVRILDNNLKNVGGTIESFIRNINIIMVNIDTKSYYLVDCTKPLDPAIEEIYKKHGF